MIALLQRVLKADVSVKGQCIADINKGLLVFLGVEKGDSEASAEKLLKRVLAYRLFADSDHKMNLDLRQSEGALLIVPQFTLAADTGKGLRPSFAAAAPPALGEKLFQTFCDSAQQQYANVQIGQFGADMKVGLINDGPVTFWLQIC